MGDFSAQRLLVALQRGQGLLERSPAERHHVERRQLQVRRHSHARNGHHLSGQCGILKIAARKDFGGRCDIEAGMAKLLAARVAWSAADNALQIHGGNGFALEYSASRLLCDARVLSIFEGAAEIQAQVIARRLLSDAE